MRIDVHGARLIARVDDSQEEVYLKGLNHDTNYGVSTNLPSVVLVGGTLYNTFYFILLHCNPLVKQKAIKHTHTLNNTSFHAHISVYVFWYEWKG